MERHLGTHDWFSGDDYGIADIALHAYTHCAEDGGIALTGYPHLRAWLARVQATPAFVAMPPYAAENIGLIAQSR
jgi:glutathione S-transferase